MSAEGSRVIERLLKGDLPLDFDWNEKEYPGIPPRQNKIPVEPTTEQAKKLKLVSEDLRDGLHGIKKLPSIEDRLRYVDALSNFGVNTMTVGMYPGKDNKVGKDIKLLLREMRDRYPEVTPIVLSLAREDSIAWTVDCKQINSKLNAIVFKGSAPSRLLVEEWERGDILDQLAWAVNEAVKNQIEVIGATEHTTQTPPNFLRKIIEVEVDNGATFFCIADTIGIARPKGVYRIVRWTRQVLDEMGAENVMIDWHGHRDMGNSLQNALTAIAAGADRIHTVARGIGERAGNTSMEAVLINVDAILRREGVNSPWNQKKLNNVIELYTEIVKIDSPNHGVLGKRSHTSSLGIHASAMFKANKLVEQVHKIANEASDDEKVKLQKLLEELDVMERTIYTAVDPESVGKEPVTTVGPFSGKQTIKLAALQMGIDHETLSDTTIEQTLRTAKKFDRELTSEELKKLLSAG